MRDTATFYGSHNCSNKSSKRRARELTEMGCALSEDGCHLKSYICQLCNILLAMSESASRPCSGGAALADEFMAEIMFNSSATPNDDTFRKRSTPLQLRIGSMYQEYNRLPNEWINVK